MPLHESMSSLTLIRTRRQAAEIACANTDPEPGRQYLRQG
jgi:hypothetical protein